jgi:hypothetical protein
VLRWVANDTGVATPAPLIKFAMIGAEPAAVTDRPTAMQLPAAGQATAVNAALVAPLGSAMTTRDHEPSLSTATSGDRRVGVTAGFEVLPTATH